MQKLWKETRTVPTKPIPPTHQRITKWGAASMRVETVRFGEIGFMAWADMEASRLGGEVRKRTILRIERYAVYAPYRKPKRDGFGTSDRTNDEHVQA